MKYAGIRVVGGNAEAVARLQTLLTFVDEPLAAEGSGDVVMLVADGASWPEPPADANALILVGSAPADFALPILGQLADPPNLNPLLECLANVHRFCRDRQDGESAICPALHTVAGASDAMARVRALITKVSGNDTTVLITGESGTGKEVVARAIHAASHRRRGPFVPVNCGAIPGELLESELFGYEKGAFTGALSAKAGRFELAAGGTLFLDEIGDMPGPMQVKVLRAIQERSFERVGGVTTLEADVRIITATHRDLESMIAEGAFREDLYYRINVFPVALPPLRDRPEDLADLIATIAARIRAEQALDVRLTDDALQLLKGYAWPGNVRELRNLLERLAIEYPEQVVARRDLPARFRGGSGPADAPQPARPVGAAGADLPTALLPINGLDLKEYLGCLERSLIEQALEDTNSVVARAADRLHIRRTTLVEKMRKYGIERA